MRCLQFLLLIASWNALDNMSVFLKQMGWEDTMSSAPPALLREDQCRQQFLLSNLGTKFLVSARIHCHINNICFTHFRVLLGALSHLVLCSTLFRSRDVHGWEYHIAFISSLNGWLD